MGPLEERAKGREGACVDYPLEGLDFLQSKIEDVRSDGSDRGRDGRLEDFCRRAQGGAGEVNSLVDDALQMEVATPVIASAVTQLIASRDESEPWARAIAMMRKGFGGHTYGASDAIVEERRTGRVGGFVRN